MQPNQDVKDFDTLMARLTHAVDVDFFSLLDKFKDLVQTEEQYNQVKGDLQRFIDDMNPKKDGGNKILYLEAQELKKNLITRCVVPDDKASVDDKYNWCLKQIEIGMQDRDEFKHIIEGLPAMQKKALEISINAKKNGVAPSEVDVREYLKNHPIITNPNKTTLMYAYDEDKGIWQMNAEARILQHVTSFYSSPEGMNGPGYQESYYNGFLSMVRGRSMRDIPEAPPDTIIPVGNGLLLRRSKRLINYTPKFFFMAKVPARYEPVAHPVKFLKFLNEITDEGPEGDKQRILLQEMFGQCLLTDYSIRSIFLLEGEGANGKSTLLAILKRFLGLGNYSSVSIARIVDDRFAAARLYGKLANIYSDIGEDVVNNSELLKLLTGGDDTITGELKFKDAFEFVNYAKLIFSCNRVPPIKDQTDAIFSRMILVRFNKQFEGTEEADPDLNKDDGTVPQKARRQRAIIRECTTPFELSGILNWALEGLDRILKNHGFSHGMTYEQRREEYLMKSNPSYAYLQANVVGEPDSYIKRNDLLANAQKWCKDHNFRQPSEKELYKAVRQNYDGIEEKYAGKGADRARAFYGIGFVESVDVKINKPVGYQGYDDDPYDYGSLR